MLPDAVLPGVTETWIWSFEPANATEENATVAARTAKRISFMAETSWMPYLWELNNITNFMYAAFVR
jgi:hypothetical protein